MPRIARPIAIVTFTALTGLMVVTPALGQGSLTLNQPSSTLVATGTVATAPITQQGAGSLSTTYSGAVGVSTFNPGALTLSIDSTSTSFTAAVSGNWAPMANGVAGTAPADYGGLANLTITTVDFAIRNAVFNISGSPTVSLTQSTPGNYTFPANQSLSFLSGSLDYRDSAGLVTPGSIDLTGQSGTNSPSVAATLQNMSGNIYSLSYPVNLTVIQTITTGVTATITVQGTIVAQGTIVPVPEPFLPLSLCFSACGAVAVWRRAKPLLI
jgi:hypothetical protein